MSNPTKTLPNTGGLPVDQKLVLQMPEMVTHGESDKHTPNNSTSKGPLVGRMFGVTPLGK